MSTANRSATSARKSKPNTKSKLKDPLTVVGMLSVKQFLSCLLHSAQATDEPALIPASYGERLGISATTASLVDSASSSPLRVRITDLDHQLSHPSSTLHSTQQQIQSNNLPCGLQI
jgi:hypothetical protein